MSRPLPRYLTESQMARLVLAPDLATPEGRRDRAMLAMLCSTGLRAAELCDLRVRDVTERLVFVRCGKGNVQRFVPTSSKTWAAIRDYLQAYPATPNEPLFRTGPNRPVTRRRLHKVISHYEQRFGLPSGVHLLRHAAATRWLNRGMSIRQVQFMLGHAHLTTTVGYLRVATDALVRDYRRCLEPQLPAAA